MRRGPSRPSRPPRDLPAAWCPRCQARVPGGQVGRSAGRRVLYCTICGDYFVLSSRGARRATAVEQRFARRDLFAVRGLAEPAAGT